MRAQGSTKKAVRDRTGPREPGYGRLQQLLRDDILEGRIAAGTRLKVSEIAERYETSTNPAREALQALEGEGLVIISPNRGASVRLFDEDLVQNIFDIRSLLEPYIVRAFAEYATREDVAVLCKYQEGCQAGVDASNYLMFHQNNTAFHDYIIERHFNVEAVRIMRQHNGWLRALSRKNPLTLAQMRRSSNEHWELIDAIEKGDPDTAVDVIGRHMRNSREIFIGNLRRDRMRDVAAVNSRD